MTLSTTPRLRVALLVLLPALSAEYLAPGLPGDLVPTCCCAQKNDMPVFGLHEGNNSPCRTTHICI